MDQRESTLRRTFLCLGISLTFLGCVITATGVAMPGWQVLDLPELNAVHEHAIFYDCILSEVTPLDALRRTREIPLPFRRTQRDISVPVKPNRRCTYKFAGSAWETQYVRMAIEEGDFAAKEHLNLHRFLPQHKAVVFFCVFTLIFALLSVLVGACSSCFIPNGILHVISIGLATSCSLLADMFFFMAAQRDENRRIRGTIGTYQQHFSYAFFIHCLGSLILLLAFLCSFAAAYLLLAGEFRKIYWRRKMKGGGGGTGKNGFVPLNIANIEEKPEKCILLSDMFNIGMASRPRMNSTISCSMDMERHPLPPPPPSPLYPHQQQQSRHLSVHSACGYRQKERGTVEEERNNDFGGNSSSASARSVLLISPQSCCSAV